MKKLDYQRIFCFISFIFILGCCAFYGGRFIKLYMEENKKNSIIVNTLAKHVKDDNIKNDDFISINNANYFINKSNTNYLMYSNILFRIIKVNNDNSIVAISNNSLTSLAFGDNLEFRDSYIDRWLNINGEKYTGILESNLNNPSKYLDLSATCTDKVSEITSNNCTNLERNNYLTLLSTSDFAVVGSDENYLVENEEYFYLVNMSSDEKIWYVNSAGKVLQGNGDDIIGVRPIITIKSNVDYVSGDGTLNNPYKFEKETSLFGSYVKLGNDIWRIYNVNDADGIVKLALNSYLEVNGKEISYKYSNNSSYYNDYGNGSVAYYLNNNFLNSLSYKNVIKEVKWSNGYYSKNDFNYVNALNTEIESKVALLSMGDIVLNSNLVDYYTMTGAIKNSQNVYVIGSNKKNYTKNIGSELKIVPTISLNKELLVKGNGTLEEPFEME